MPKTLIINLFGGPGSGKTSVATDVFASIRKAGIKAHYAEEFAKELVGDGNWHALNNQIYVFGTQHKRITQWEGRVDYIVTDSPLLLTCIYGTFWPKSLHQLALDEHNKTRSLNVFIDRPEKYEAGLGRSESLARSIALDKEILNMLISYKVPFTRIGVGVARDFIMEEITKNG